MEEINTNNFVDKIKTLNNQFKINDKNGIPIDGRNYIFKKGKIPILISAPHAVKQIREEKVKSRDYLTGPLAIYLADKCDCSYFVRIYNDNDDPNYPLGITLTNIENIYLKELIKFISNTYHFLVIDFHGNNKRKTYDCSMWSDNYSTCSKDIINIFFKNFLYNNFSVDNGTEYLGGQVTRQISKITNAFQLEVERRLRTVKLESCYLLKIFLNSMEKSINETYEYYLKLKKNSEF